MTLRTPVAALMNLKTIKQSQSSVACVYSRSGSVHVKANVTSFVRDGIVAKKCKSSLTDKKIDVELVSDVSKISSLLF